MKIESQRQQKVGRLLQQDLADIFQKEMSYLVSSKMVSVTKVRVTPDLALAKIYLSIFPGDGSETLKNIQNKTKEIRYRLGLRIKKQTRIVPNLVFYLDDSLDYIDKIDELLNS